MVRTMSSLLELTGWERALSIKLSWTEGALMEKCKLSLLKLITILILGTLDQEAFRILLELMILVQTVGGSFCHFDNRTS